MDGKELLLHIANLKENIQKYIEAKISYFGVLAFEKAVKVLSLFMANVFVMMAGLLALIFLSGAAAIYIGMLLGDILYGMLVMGVVYVFILIILYAARRRIFGRMAIRIVKQFFLQDEDKAPPR